MAMIVIRDLPESVELDRQAMQAIAGGARYRTRPPIGARPEWGGRRIVDYFSAGTQRPPGKPTPAR